MIGSSRAPSIPTNDVLPGQEVTYNYYSRGHMDSVDNVSIEIEDVVSSDNEQFFCELN